MSPIADALASVSVFRALDAPVTAHIAATAPLWTERALLPGTVLWRAGDLADELALVREGTLDVVVAGQQVSEVRAGELLGEASALLAGEVRTATIRARDAAVLLVLGQGQLATLRREHPVAYDVLLDRSLDAIADRVETNGARIAALAQSERARPTRDDRPIVARGWRRASGATRVTRASPLAAMRLLPVLARAPEPLLETIAWAMAPQFIDEGEALLLEGDPGDRVYLVAGGQIDVLRNVEPEGAIRLAGLQTGALFGTGALLLGRPRNASCIAARPSWVYGMARDDLRRLHGEAGRLWREALLCALRTQLLDVSEHLALLEAARDGAGDLPVDELLRAEGHAQAFQGSAEPPRVSLAATLTYDDA